MRWLGWPLRLGIVGVAGLALYTLSPVILNDWTGREACPQLGPIPACYIVGLGYCAMAGAALLEPRRLTAMFLLGWAPVFLAASTGTVMEIFVRPTCPLSETGIPMCYYSLVTSSLLLPAFWVGRRLADETARAGPGRLRQRRARQS